MSRPGRRRLKVVARPAGGARRRRAAAAAVGGAAPLDAGGRASRCALLMPAARRFVAPAWQVPSVTRRRPEVESRRGVDRRRGGSLGRRPRPHGPAGLDVDARWRRGHLVDGSRDGRRGAGASRARRWLAAAGVDRRRRPRWTAGRAVDEIARAIARDTASAGRAPALRRDPALLVTWGLLRADHRPARRRARLDRRAPAHRAASRDWRTSAAATGASSSPPKCCAPSTGSIRSPGSRAGACGRRASTRATTRC